MKREFYNPFKPHVVEFTNGVYAVRKLTLQGWKFYGNEQEHWWTNTDKHTARYFTLDSLELAKQLLEIVELRNTIETFKVKKVH